MKKLNFLLNILCVITFVAAIIVFVIEIALDIERLRIAFLALSIIFVFFGFIAYSLSIWIQKKTTKTKK